MDEEYVEEMEGYYCPLCGGVMLSGPCWVVGCADGLIDLHEFDDPINFSPGEYELCDECRGRGVLVWCPGCGYDPARAAEGEVVNG